MSCSGSDWKTSTGQANWSAWSAREPESDRLCRRPRTPSATSAATWPPTGSSFQASRSGAPDAERKSADLLGAASHPAAGQGQAGQKGEETKRLACIAPVDLCIPVVAGPQRPEFPRIVPSTRRVRGRRPHPDLPARQACRGAPNSQREPIHLGLPAVGFWRVMTPTRAGPSPTSIWRRATPTGRYRRRPVPPRSGRLCICWPPPSRRAGGLSSMSGILADSSHRLLPT